jgi:hypothetical protein
MFLVIRHDHAPASLLGHLFRRARIGAIPRISHQQNVNHRIRALRRLNRFFDAHLASFILRIGDHHDGFAARFSVQLLVAGQVNGVVERSSGNMTRRHRPRIEPPRRRINSCLADRPINCNGRR